MQFAQVVRARRMVRAYRPEPVDPAAVERILEAARRAPSAGFSQGQSFVVVTGAGTRQRIAQACDEPRYVARGLYPWISQAPVHVVPCVSRAAYAQRYREPDKAGAAPIADWLVPWWWVDGGAALMLLLLATVDEGLAAGLLGVADPGRLRDVLGIPADVQPLGVVTIGHPAPDRPAPSLARGRRPRPEVVHYERWRP